MEIVPGITIGLDLVVGIMIKISMLLLLVLGIVMVRQGMLMDRVVNFPVGRNIQLLIWGYFAVSLLLTIVVLLA